MENFRLLLLAVALSTIISIGNCQMLEDAVKDLRQAAKMESIASYHYEFEAVPVKTAVEHLKKTYEKLNATNYKMNQSSSEMLNDVSTVLRKKTAYMSPARKINQFFTVINDLHRKYNRFVSSIKNDETEIDHFLMGISKLLNNIEDALKYIHYSLMGARSLSPEWFEVLKENMTSSEDKGCHRQVRLTQGHIFNFFRFFFDMEYRGSLLLITVYQYLTMRKIENHRGTMKKAQVNSQTRMIWYMHHAVAAMKVAPRYIFKCDDGKHIERQNYIELRGMSQGFILTPSALDLDNNCNLQEPIKDICSTEPKSCFYEKCSELGGLMNDCHDLNEDKEPLPKLMTVCQSEDPGKFYSWATLDDRTFGNYTDKHECSQQLQHINMVTSEWESLGKPYNPTYQKKCFCNCKREKWVHGDIRAISYDSVQSNYAKNRVITDLKFQETNGMLHIKVQEGLLLPGGAIDQSNLTWIEPPNTSPFISSMSLSPNYTFFGSGYFQEWFVDRDFAYVSTNLSLDLEDLFIGNDYVVISVGFKKSPLGDPDLMKIQLEICGLKYDFDTGILDETDVTCNSSDVAKRTFLDLGSPTNPVNTKLLKNDISSSPSTVKFQQTDWKKDLGQSIVPFFYSQALKPGLALPLSGVGLHHRGCKDCGGFISFKLITYDIAQHMNLTVPHRFH